MAVTIRETKIEDYAPIETLLEQAHLKDSYFDEVSFRRMLERNKGFCYVAELEGQVVGTLFGTHDGAFRGYIQKVAVNPDYRQHGIGSDLVRRTIEAFNEFPIPLIFAHIERTNIPSILLFRSLGFEIRDSHLLTDIGYKKRE